MNLAVILLVGTVLFFVVEIALGLLKSVTLLPLGAAPLSLPGWTVEKVMSVVVSIVLLAASLYVILSKSYDDGTQKWAYGVIGSIIGFWVKRAAS